MFRMLNPPPILRVTGPLLPQLTNATIQTVFTDEESQDHTLSAQSQRIPLTYTAPVIQAPSLASGSKRYEREHNKMIRREQASRSGFGQTLPFERLKKAEKEREALSDGLGFPGLWVSEGIGRSKEFRLELCLGTPNEEDSGSDKQVASVTPNPPTNASSGISGAIDPALESGQDPIRPTGDQGTSRLDAQYPASTNQYHDHQTLDQVSNDISQYLVDEHGRIGGAIQTDNPSGSQTQAAQESSNVASAATPGRQDSWATFTSAPLAVVSKPSQKTSKARSMTSCLTLNDSFALWVRIHGQTVRTKYMKLDTGTSTDRDTSLTTRTSQWTPFKFEVVDHARSSITSDRASQSSRRRPPVQKENILTYGSIGRLVDLQSGIKTETMRLVKIDKNENVVGTDYGHPVSDLQRVGFIRLLDGVDDYTGGGRWYLSAPASRLGGAEVTNPADATLGETYNPNQQPPTLDSIAENSATSGVAIAPKRGGRSKGTDKEKKKKTKRFALADIVVAEDAGGAEFSLSWAKAGRFEAERSRGFGRDAVKKMEVCDNVEDWMCWTLGGVCKSHIPLLSCI